MPITNENLAARANRHILLPARLTVGEAIARFCRAGGKSWWPLIIDFGDHRYALTWIYHLAKQAGLLDTLLPSYEEQLRILAQSDRPLAKVRYDAILDVVKQDDLSYEEAYARAARSPGRALAVLKRGHYVGLVTNRFIKDF